MTRLFPSRYYGVHPALPDDPEPYPPNQHLAGSVVFGSITGLGASGLSRIFGRPSYPGRILYFTACSTALWGGFIILQHEIRIHQLVKPFILSQGLQPKPFTLAEFNGRIDIDDYMLGLGAVGALAASTLRGPRIAPGVGSLSKIVGGFSFGAAAGCSFQQIRLPSQELKRRTALRRKTLKQLLEKQDSTALGDVHLHLQTHERAQSTQAQLQPGSYPHVAYEVDGEVQWVPVTDYQWEPASRSEGMKQLDEQIAKLTQFRTDLAKDAEYLWIEVADREYTWNNEKDPEKKVVSYTALRLLSDMHYHIYMEISQLDWMIAGSRKRLEQMKSDTKWMPLAHAIDFDHYDPKEIVKRLKAALKEAKQLTSIVKEGAVVVDEENDTETTIGAEDADALQSIIKGTEEAIKDFESRAQNFKSTDSSATDKP